MSDIQVKVVVLLKKRSDISYQTFRDHYENRHVPLVTRLLPYFTDYRRNYLVRGEALSTGTRDICEFDVITELRFSTSSSYQKFIDGLAEPSIHEQLSRCEADFLDTATMAMYRVEEARAPAPT